MVSFLLFLIGRCSCQNGHRKAACLSPHSMQYKKATWDLLRLPSRTKSNSTVHVSARSMGVVLCPPVFFRPSLVTTSQFRGYHDITRRCCITSCCSALSLLAKFCRYLNLTRRCDNFPSHHYKLLFRCARLVPLSHHHQRRLQALVAISTR